jgi:hypothetical protein
MPLFGMWEAKFEPQDPTSPEIRGYLQLYVTDHKFKMHVGTKTQSFDPSGTWKMGPKQVTLTMDTVEVSGYTEDEAKIRHQPYFLPDEVRAGLGKELTLNLASDMKQMKGLEIALGKTVGRFQFKKQAQSSYIR